MPGTARRLVVEPQRPEPKKFPARHNAAHDHPRQVIQISQIRISSTYYALVA